MVVGTGVNLSHAARTIPASRFVVSTVTNNGSGKCRFTIVTAHGASITDQVSVIGNSVAGYNTTHTISAVTTYTFDTDINYSADGTGGTWATV